MGGFLVTLEVTIVVVVRFRGGYVIRLQTREKVGDVTDRSIQDKPEAGVAKLECEVNTVEELRVDEFLYSAIDSFRTGPLTFLFELT